MENHEILCSPWVTTSILFLVVAVPAWMVRQIIKARVTPEKQLMVGQALMPGCAVLNQGFSRLLRNKRFPPFYQRHLIPTLMAFSLVSVTVFIFYDRMQRQFGHGWLSFIPAYVIYLMFLFVYSKWILRPGSAQHFSVTDHEIAHAHVLTYLETPLQRDYSVEISNRYKVGKQTEIKKIFLVRFQCRDQSGSLFYPWSDYAFTDQKTAVKFAEEVQDHGLTLCKYRYGSTWILDDQKNQFAFMIPSSEIDQKGNWLQTVHAY